MKLLMEEIGVKGTRAVITAIAARWGDDFTDCSLTIFTRRLIEASRTLGIADLDTLLSKIETGPRADYDHFLSLLLPRTTEMHRDPSFWRLLKEELLPMLIRQGEPLVIWQAAFDTGEELFSLLVVLDELDCQDVTIYSSYMGERMVAAVRTGLLPLRRTDVDSANYHRYNVNGDFSRWLREESNSRFFSSPLLEKVTFIPQQPEFVIPDGLQANLILCRNQLLYFNSSLSHRNVLRLAEALRPGGYLALGVQERLESLSNISTFTLHNERESVYRRRRQ